MKLRNIKFRPTVLVILVLMAVSFLISPSSATQEKDALTVFIETKLSEKMPNTRLTEIQRVAKTITDGAKISQLNPLLIMAVMEQESRYQPHVVGRHGEIGLLQLRPETAEWILKQNNKIWGGKKTLLDPRNNVQIGILYLSWLNKKFKNKQATLSAYNMGPGATEKFLKKKIMPKVYYTKVYSKYQGLLMEYETYQLSLNPEASPVRLTASK